MKARRLTLAILTYVSLDLSSPFVPGAFNFNPDESVEMASRLRESTEERLPAGVTPPVPPRLTGPLGSRDGSVALRSTNHSSAVSEWLVDVRLAHAPVPEVSPPSEEH